MSKRKKPDPAVIHRAVDCAHCGRPYLIPCDDKRKTSCQNWLYRQRPKSKSKRTR